MHYDNDFVIENNQLVVVIYKHEVLSSDDKDNSEDKYYDLSSIQECKYIHPWELSKFLKLFDADENQKEIEEIEKLKQEGRKKAEQNIKRHLILKKIAEKEDIKVSDEEINEELKAIAEANNLPLARVVDTFNKEGRKEELRNTLQVKKTVDFLVENAIIK